MMKKNLSSFAPFPDLKALSKEGVFFCSQKSAATPMLHSTVTGLKASGIPADVLFKKK
jgi:hypothetical protein